MIPKTPKKLLQLSVKLPESLRTEFLTAAMEAEGRQALSLDEMQRRGTDSMRAALLLFARSTIQVRRQWVAAARTYDLDQLTDSEIPVPSSRRR